MGARESEAAAHPLALAAHGRHLGAGPFGDDLPLELGEREHDVHGEPPLVLEPFIEHLHHHALTLVLSYEQGAGQGQPTVA